MSFAWIFDRFYWSMMWTIFLGLLWLRFIQPFIPCVSVGLIFCIMVGLAYFVIGLRDKAKQVRIEKEIEQVAYQDMINEHTKGDA